MYRMIIVDDDSFVLRGLEREIDWGAFGIRLIGTFSNGKQAAEFLEKKSADIVLTDIKMPEMDGLELIAYLHQSLPDARVVVLSGYGEFEYAQQAIRYNVFDYLLKPVTLDKIREVFTRMVASMDSWQGRVSEKLRKLEPILEETYYQNLFTGVIPLEDLNLYPRPGEGYHRFVVVSVKLLQEDPHDPPTRYGELCSRLYRYLKEWAEPAPDYTPLVMGADELLLILRLKITDRPGDVRSFLQKLVERLLEQCETGLCLGVSQSFGQLADSGSHYSRVQELLGGKPRLKSGRVYRVEEEREDAVRGKADALFAKALERWDEGEVLQALEGVCGALEETSGWDGSRLREYYRDLLYDLYGAYVLRCLPGRDFSRGWARMDEELARARTLDELHRMAVRQCESLFELGRRKKKGKSFAAVAQVVRYIHQNINTGVSLHQIAPQVYLTPNYLGTVFKEEMGMSFNEYLIAARMELAKRLLRTGKYKIYEVSSMVGYKNPNHFSKLFTEYTGGVCPSDYPRTL